MKRNLIFWVLIAAILASCTRPEPEIEVTSVSISQPGAEMVEGESLQLTALVQPTGAKDKSVVWASSKTSVAVVSQDGLVQALREGSSKITATSVNGKVGSCAVTVSRKVVAVQSVAFEKTALSLVEGDTEALSVSISPADATETDVAWSSSNENVVTVNDYGVITAVGAGEAVVKAMVGGITASCRVTVAQKVIPVSAIEISSPSLNIVLGTAETLSVTVLPTDATDKSVTWASVNPAIATVDQTGIVSAKTVGTTTITATTTDGGFVAACEVTVCIPYVAVTSVTLDKSTATLEKGKTLNLTATVLPENASVKSVSWSSGNTNVANVDQAGKVTAVGGGTATITAKCGDCSATCTVTVVVPVSGVSLNENSLTMTEGESVTLVTSIVPADATDQALSWSSSNPAVASVDESGLVLALNEGAATIIVSTHDGGKTASCAVTVKPAFVPVRSVTLDKVSVSITEGESYTLVATVNPANASDKSVTWASNDTGVATVDDTGKVTAVDEGSTIITATCGDCSATCFVDVSLWQKYDGEDNGHRYVDLGLPSGLKWATCNVGADTPVGYGDYYAWGETETKNSYSYATYKWANGSYSSLTKYNYSSAYGPVVDNKTTLEPGDDVAYVKWGDNWRMPTWNEFRELTDNCVTEWKSHNGVNGLKLTSKKNGNSIFLPASGNIEGVDLENVGRIGCYRSSTLKTSRPTLSWFLSVSVNGAYNVDSRSRCDGLSVRPVCTVRVVPLATSIALSQSDAVLITGQSLTLTANILPVEASGTEISWSSSNANLCSVANGVVTAGNSTGRATITASVDGVSATCSILVVRDSYTGVYASYNGGSIISINDVIQSGSQLNFGVTNYSSETITVVSLQLIDGVTGSQGNVMSIGKDIVPGDSSGWTITIGAAGIHSPIARFVYTFRGTQYTCEAQYHSFSF